MADDLRSRRQAAVATFIARRGELALTQEDVARTAQLAVRTVVNFESQGVWPNARTRAGLEKAVQWPLGELARLAAPEPEPDIPESLRRQVAALTPRQRMWMREWLAAELRGDGNDHPQSPQAAQA